MSMVVMIPDPDFYPSGIPNLGSHSQQQQPKGRGKKLAVLPFFVAWNFIKLKNILFLIGKEKICVN